MPVYNETDDSDWRDDESMTSADDFSSHTGDLESVEDSDFEYLTRSSSQAQTETEGEETDNDDIASTGPASSIVTGTSTNSVVSSSAEDHPADTVLRSTELPDVTREPEAMDDSTATITHPSLERADTITLNTPVEQVPTHGFPFNILYAGSSSLKSKILHKLGQALMASVLREPVGQSTSSPVSTDWSSGYTSVVPITEFNSSDAVPEVEFVEDSLVKVRVQEINTLQGFTGRRQSQFMCQVDQNTRVISCYHRHRGNRSICSWIENSETCPSLLVYCSPVRGEKYDFSLQKMEEFASIHHIPLLAISEWEISNKRYTYKLNQGDFVAVESSNMGMILGYETITPSKFFELDSHKLGVSLWKNATASHQANKSTGNVSLLKLFTDIQDYCKFNLQKRVMLRIVAMVLVALLLFFFKVPFFSSNSGSIDTIPIVKTAIHKDLGTKPVAASEIMSIPHSTVTVTEQLTVTVPIVHTKTVTTSTTVTPEPKSSHRPASTIVLHAITKSVNVPRASLAARLPDVDYGYAFGYDDNTMQLFLETDHSVLLRLPRVYRDSTSARPKVKITVTRDRIPIDFQLREWKKNDLAFIVWSPEDSHDRLEIKVWTESNPLLREQVIIDYTEPIIDPRLWELLGKSQHAAWQRVSKMRGTLDEKVKSLAKDVKDRVSDSAKYSVVEEKVGGYMRMAKKIQDDARDVAGRQFEEFKSKYPHLFTKPTISEEDYRRFNQYKQEAQRKMDDYMILAQKEAIRLTNEMKRQFGKSAVKWKGMNGWNKPCKEKSQRCGDVGSKWRKFTGGRF